MKNNRYKDCENAKYTNLNSYSRQDFKDLKGEICV